MKTIIIIIVLGFLTSCARHTKADEAVGSVAVSHVDEDSLRYFLDNVYGERNSYSKAADDHAGEVRRYLASVFGRLGFQARVSLWSSADGTRHGNVTAVLKGRKPGVVVVGAHLDTVKGSPGGDDNGSGLAALLELARCLQGGEPEHTMVLVAFDQEEDQMQGSAYFIEHWPAGDSIRAMINLDMIGYMDQRPGSQHFPDGFDRLYPEVYSAVMRDGSKGDFAVGITNERSAGFMEQFKQLAAGSVPALKLVSLEVKGNGEEMPDSRRSDHANFWDKGIAALYLGDGANTRDPYYHTPGDTRDKVNFKQVMLVTQAVLAFITGIVC